VALQLRVRVHQYAQVWHDGIHLRIQHCATFVVAETRKLKEAFFISTRRKLAICTVLLAHLDVIRVGACNIKRVIDYLIQVIGLLYLTWAAEIAQVV
jgi:hypothetical protein